MECKRPILNITPNGLTRNVAHQETTRSSIYPDNEIQVTFRTDAINSDE